MAQVKISVPSNSYPHPLDCTHLTTLNFFQPLIALYQPVIKNTRINVNVGSLVRAIAMQRPAFADIKLRLRSFFVPYYSVMESFESFLTGTPFHGNVISTAPQIQYRWLVQFLLKHVKISFYETEDTHTASIPVEFEVSGSNKYAKESWQRNTIDLLSQLEDKHDFVVVDCVTNFSWQSPRIRFWQLDLDYIGRAFLKMLYAFGFNLSFSAIMNANYGNHEFPSLDSISYGSPINPLIGWYFLFRSNYANPYTESGLTDAQLRMPDSDPRWSRLNIDTNKSKMPFLCVARIWEDWYISNQYQTYLNTIETFIHGTPSQSAAVFNDVMEIILNSFYPSEKDIYMNAWDNPVSPNDSNSNFNLTISDPTNNSSTDNKSIVQVYSATSPAANPSNGTPFVRSSTTYSPQNFTQFIDTCLHKLTDWMKRKQLSGSKTIDSYKNEYDETLSTEQLRRSFEIGHYDISLNIDEIMSNSDTYNPEDGNGMKVGDYTGRMQGGSNINDVHFDFDSNQYFGAFVITATILPRIDYYQGLNPLLDNLKPEHFWHPDLDGLAPEVIAKEEYYNDFKMADFYNMPDSVADGKTAYGFTGSYHNIKSRQSIISGDFRLSNRNVGYDCWHTFRDVNPLLIRKEWSDYSSSELQQLLKHSPMTISTRNDLQQYNRLFAETDLDANDGFVCVFHFKIDMWNSSKPLYDTYDWYDEDCKKIDATINGTQLF